MTRITRSMLALGLLVSLLALGCSARVADLTLISTKNIDLSHARLDAREGQRVTGKDCEFMVLGLPLGIPNLEDAVDDALEIGGGNIMVDQVTYQKSFYFLLFGQMCLEAEGTVLSTTPASKRTTASRSRGR